MKRKKSSYRNLIVLIIAIVLLITIGIAITMARYRSKGHTALSAEVAFYVIEEGYMTGNIMLSGLYPREEVFEYDFTVANTDGTNTAEVTMNYNMDITITTNLPLNIEIHKKEEGSETYSKITDANILENEIVLDESNQCYVRKIKIKNQLLTYNVTQIDQYKLVAEFPIEYNEVEEYEGVIDNASILLEATQKIN